MFGVGFAYQMQSAARRCVAFSGRYWRRIIGLLAFGALNIACFFFGDILVVYAVLGTILFLFRNASQKTLIVWGCIIYGIQILVIGLMALMVYLGVTFAPEEMAKTAAEFAVEDSRAIEVFGSGSFLDAAAYRTSEYVSGFPFILMFQGFGAFAFFLFGLAAVRSGVIARAYAPIWKPARRYALPLGMLISGAGGWLMLVGTGMMDPLMMLGMLLVLILVLIPEIGHEVKGGRRWLRFGSIGFQPVELLKIVLIIYVAAYLERKQEMLSSFFRGLTPNFLVTGFFLFLILLQPDFGAVILIATTVLMMLYVGGGRPLHIFGSLIGMGLIGGFLIASHSYRVKRILAFLNPWEDPLNSGFQIIQSYIALGTGGWFGKGLGESHQKLFFLPDAHTDFIFAVIGEELGFLWIFVLVGIFSLHL